MTETADMVTAPRFDHRAQGTPPGDWRTARAALPTRVLAGGHDHLVVLAAHPDDETLGAGGLLAEAARAGAQITVIVATDGEASHPGSPTHRPADLARLRTDEVAAAVRALAPQAELVLLHRPDGRLTLDQDGLAAALDSVAADATVLAAPWRGDGHPDHEACGLAAATVSRARNARLVEYPIWGWHWGVPGKTGPLRDGRWVTVALKPVTHAAKIAAIAEHRSQYLPLSPAPGDEPVLTPELLAYASTDHEVFLESAPTDLPARYFDRLYAHSPDPWNIETGFYEHRKRQLLLAALPRPRFGSAFEPGCARGATTIELARRCDRVLACDISAAAVDAATERTEDLPHVRVVRAAIPHNWPDERFDLVVVSEVGYYLADPTVLAEQIRDALTEDAVVAACHWRHPAAGYPSRARDVHAALGRDLHHLTHVEDDFLLDVWSRDPNSVAAAQDVLR